MAASSIGATLLGRVDCLATHARPWVFKAWMTLRTVCAREHQALKALHADFTAEMATIAAHVPMLALLPDVLATTLRVPDYLEAPEDDTRALK